jgi:hypothetical protein
MMPNRSWLMHQQIADSVLLDVDPFLSHLGWWLWKYALRIASEVGTTTTEDVWLPAIQTTWVNICETTS